MMRSSAFPTELTLRVYQMGFGDCFLLTFHYPARGAKKEFERHVLIDFGSAAAPKAFGPDLLDRVAEDIRNECGGKLHVVVATHRHRSAVGGFERTSSGEGPGDVIRACKPEIVLQPWTEDPDAARGSGDSASEPMPARTYVRALNSMSAFSASILRSVKPLQSAVRKRLGENLTFLAKDNQISASAAKNLASMGKRPPRYLRFGAKLEVGAILPGVKVHVLGPSPTGVDFARDEAAFWRLQSLAGRKPPRAGKTSFTGRCVKIRPPFTRWLIPRLRASRGEQLLELARNVDEAVNNTSLVLVFEVNGRTFLFPGDAQFESWAMVLQNAQRKPQLRRLLTQVELYKVSDHGNPHATPKPLWDLFRWRSRKSKGPRLRGILSTMTAARGKAARDIDAARQKFLHSLKTESDCFSTQDLRSKREIKKVFRIKL